MGAQFVWDYNLLLTCWYEENGQFFFLNLKSNPRHGNERGFNGGPIQEEITLELSVTWLHSALWDNHVET